MPELPEVETIRRGLEKPLTGSRIESAEFTLPRLLLGSKAPELARRLAGQNVGAVLRRGKYIVLELDRDSLVFHLGMTGQLTFAPENADKDKHTHAILRLHGGGRIQFRDPRTFGRIIFIPGRDWGKHVRLRKLGPEPLDLNIRPFLSKNLPLDSHRPIKALLLDQTFLAGVGNIYADEALFASSIHPRRSVHTLRAEDWEALLKAVKAVLKKGIRNQGTTFSDYRKPDGTLGHNYDHLLAYGRGGQPCLRCGTTMLKTTVAQRGTVFCPECQPIRKQGKPHANSMPTIHRTRMDKTRRRRHT